MAPIQIDNTRRELAQKIGGLSFIDLALLISRVGLAEIL